MSTAPDAFSEEDAFSGEAEEQTASQQNGRREPAGEPSSAADGNADPFPPPDGPEESSANVFPAGPIAETPVMGCAAPAFTQGTPEVHASPDEGLSVHPENTNTFPGRPATPLPAATDETLFHHYEYAPPVPPRRKPDLADCVLFTLLGIAGFFCSGLLMLAAVHYHLFGVTSFKEANDEIHYRIGSQAAWYIITLLFCSLVFRLAWRRSFFEGLQWRAAAAADRIGRLAGATSACFVAAIVDQLAMPGPANTPIDQTFRMPGAVWLLFVFGVTLAPLIEEITFRGLLLPALCTAYDWTREHFTQLPRLAPDEDGFPRWSRPAMIFASVVVSIPFALMHGEQTAYSIGPFLLLVGISLVLCWVRLAVRSLAASVLVHSSYNLLLFSLMFLGTGGFRHLDRM